MADQKSIEDMTFKEASIELEQIVRSLRALHGLSGRLESRHAGPPGREHSKERTHV